MDGNCRVPIYREIKEALGRHITPDERIRLDRFLDSLGISRRNG